MCMLAGLSACNSKAIQSITKNVVTSQTIWDDYFVGNIIFEDKAPESEGSRIYHSLIADPKAYISCSIAKSCPKLRDPMDCSTPDSSVLHCLPEFAQIYVHWVSDAIQPSHPLPPCSPFAFNPSQHQGLFQWVPSLYPVAKALKLQLQDQSVLPMNIRIDSL